MLEEKINKTMDEIVLNLMKETEKCLEKFVNTYKPEGLTDKEFLSLYNISYRIEQEGSYIQDGVMPRLFLDIKLKTPEEYFMEMNNG